MNVRTRTAFCVALVAIAAAWSQPTAGADDQESGPSYVRYRAIEDVVYGNKDGLALTMDILTPEEGANGLGIVLVASGGWRSGKSNVLEDEETRRQREHWIQGLLKEGYTLFIARHGSIGKFHVPEMVEDIRRSVRFVRHHAREYVVDPNHLGITSGSSGAHLALMVGLTGDDGKADAKDAIDRESSRVQAVVAWFPPTDLVNFGAPMGYKALDSARPGFFETVVGKIEDLEAQLKAISPIEQVSADDPPVLLIHGDKDKTVPLQQSEVFKAKYEEAGLPVKLIVHPGGGHTYWPGILDQYQDVGDWFEMYLKPQ